MKSLGGLIYLFFALATAMIGQAIHHSITWSIIDFFFAPLAWLKWLLCHEVCISIIKAAFSFFLK